MRLDFLGFLLSHVCPAKRSSCAWCKLRACCHGSPNHQVRNVKSRLISVPIVVLLSSFAGCSWRDMSSVIGFLNTIQKAHNSSPPKSLIQSQLCKNERDTAVARLSDLQQKCKQNETVPSCMLLCRLKCVEKTTAMHWSVHESSTVRLALEIYDC